MAAESVHRHECEPASDKSGGTALYISFRLFRHSVQLLFESLRQYFLQFAELYSKKHFDNSFQPAWNCPEMCAWVEKSAYFQPFICAFCYVCIDDAAIFP